MASSSSWPLELGELVRLRSGGRLVMAEDSQVGRHLVAQQELAAQEPVLTEFSLLCGSDAASALRKAAAPEDAEGMLDAWARPEAGGSNPLAHVDLFCNYALLREAAVLAAKGKEQELAPEQLERLERLERLTRWFCKPGQGCVDLAAQEDKLQMVHGALRPELQELVSLEDLRQLDDVLTRNLEEFTGAPAVFCGTERDGQPPCLSRRRFQGIFPCKDLIQHSCAPNCLSIAGPEAGAGGRLVMQIVPLRPIAKGEQLTWCYLPYWKQLWPTQLRRHALQENWQFFCRCRRCSGLSPAGRESVMAFRCPSCGAGELCPDQAVAALGDEAGQDAGHVATLRQAQVIKAMSCAKCSLQLTAGAAAETAHAGYLERCVAQEAAVFGLPWKGVLGRDLGQAKPVDLDLLAPHHWLLADHASHELENAQAIMQTTLLAEPGAHLPGVEAFLKKSAQAAGSAAAALTRLLLEGRPGAEEVALSVALPELLLSKALCTGLSDDFAACLSAHGRIFKGCQAAESMVAAAEKLCSSPQNFLAISLPAGSQQLELERARVEEWLSGVSADDPRAFSLWVLRRLWLCPDFGAEEEEEEAEEEAEEVDEPQEVEVRGPKRAKAK